MDQLKVCPRCGKEFKLTQDAYHKRVLAGTDMNMCHSCIMLELMTTTTKDYKETIVCSQCGKEFHISKSAWAVRKRRNKPLYLCTDCSKSNAQSARFAAYTKEELLVYTKPLREKYREYIDNPENRKKHSEKTKAFLKTLPEEIRIKMRNSALAGMERWRQNLSEEEKDKISKEKSAYMKKWWASLSKEEYDAICQQRKDAFQKLPDDKKLKKLSNLLFNHSNFGPTEYMFNDKMKEIGLNLKLDYEWGYFTYPYIDEHFWDIYGKKNPITNDNICPYKVWDFKIFNCNGDDILIDIDGSIHIANYFAISASGVKYNNIDKMKYLDDRRIHQIPPHHTAYIIKCYDDILNDETPVQNIITGESIKFKDLIQIIIESSLSKFKKSEISDVISEMICKTDK